MQGLCSHPPAAVVPSMAAELPLLGVLVTCSKAMLTTNWSFTDLAAVIKLQLLMGCQVLELLGGMLERLGSEGCKDGSSGSQQQQHGRAQGQPQEQQQGGDCAEGDVCSVPQHGQRKGKDQETQHPEQHKPEYLHDQQQRQQRVDVDNGGDMSRNGSAAANAAMEAVAAALMAAGAVGMCTKGPAHVAGAAPDKRLDAVAAAAAKAAAVSRLHKSPALTAVGATLKGRTLEAITSVLTTGIFDLLDVTSGATGRPAALECIEAAGAGSMAELLKSDVCRAVAKAAAEAAVASGGLCSDGLISAAAASVEVNKQPQELADKQQQNQQQQNWQQQQQQQNQQQQQQEEQNRQKQQQNRRQEQEYRDSQGDSSIPCLKEQVEGLLWAGLFSMNSACDLLQWLSYNLARAVGHGLDVGQGECQTSFKSADEVLLAAEKAADRGSPAAAAAARRSAAGATVESIVATTMPGAATGVAAARKSVVAAAAAAGAAGGGAGAVLCEAVVGAAAEEGEQAGLNALIDHVSAAATAAAAKDREIRRPIAAAGGARGGISGSTAAAAPASCTAADAGAQSLSHSATMRALERINSHADTLQKMLQKDGCSGRIIDRGTYLLYSSLLEQQGPWFMLQAAFYGEMVERLNWESCWVGKCSDRGRGLVDVAQQLGVEGSATDGQGCEVGESTDLLELISSAGDMLHDVVLKLPQQLLVEGSVLGEVRRKGDGVEGGYGWKDSWWNRPAAADSWRILWK